MAIDSNTIHHQQWGAHNRSAVQASQPVDVQTLLPEQKKIGAHMAALGILYPVQIGDKPFLCPTFMAEMLSGGKQAAGAGSTVTGFIVVETSFRLYAYTTSPVQVCLVFFSSICTMSCWCIQMSKCNAPALSVLIIVSVTGRLVSIFH
jgi:hypothetical protein